ncbi:MAG: hypothetical protein NVS3B7_02270 [Candidatus Elarobacter sp.]
MTNSSSTNTTLITFAVVVFVVVRFLYQELKARVVQKRTLWIRPAFLVVVSALLVALAFGIPGVQPGLLALALVLGAVAGTVTGTLVVRFTTFERAEMPDAVRALGSTKTVVVWIVALALRFAFRLLFSNGSTSVQFTLNVFTIVLVAAAFVVVALGSQRAIARYAGT